MFGGKLTLKNQPVIAYINLKVGSQLIKHNGKTYLVRVEKV